MNGLAAASFAAIVVSAVALVPLPASQGEGPSSETGARGQVVASPSPTLRVVSSVPDPSEPVSLRWTVRPMDDGGGWRIVLQGGTIHAIVAAVRLVDPSGEVIATAPAAPLLDRDPCLGTSGLVQAQLVLPAEGPIVAGAEWPGDYRLEASVGPTWRSTTLTYVGC